MVAVLKNNILFYFLLSFPVIYSFFHDVEGFFYTIFFFQVVPYFMINLFKSIVIKYILKDKNGGFKMICQNCGCLNASNSPYCKNCGSPLINNSPMDNAQPQYTNSSNSNAIIIICITVILLALIIAGTFLVMSNNNGDANALINNTHANAHQAASDEKTQSAVTQDNSEESVTESLPLEIRSGSFYTGSSLSDKTKCTVFVGSQYSGQQVKISVLYSRDGSNLNQGKVVPVTVDGSGYVTVYSANAFKYYPDYAYITLYDGNGYVQDTRTVYMDARGGTQSF